MIVVVDRIEGKYAVIELPDRTTKDILLEELPTGTKLGDCLNLDEGKYTFDSKETDKRKEKVQRLLDSLWNK